MTDDDDAPGASAQAGQAEPRRSRARRALEAWTSGTRAPIHIAMIAVLLALPTLFVGELLDDHLMRAWALSGGAWWDAFHFTSAAELPSLREQGMFGWWASDELSLRFFRPLASLTHALDHALWPGATWLMHLENVVIYVLLCVLVTRLLQRVHGPGPIAGIAALVFAIDEAHAATLGWISARNTLLALVFGVLALTCHLRWRAPPADTPGATRWPWALLGLACFALALLSAEAGLCLFGYVLAWSLCCERGPLLRRLGPTLPYAALIIGWRVLYSQHGFGAHGTSIYLDPLAEPGLFLTHALAFPPAMVTAQLSLPLVDLILGAPLVLWVLVAAFVPLMWALAPVLRGDTDEARHARFWLVSMLLAAVPIAATYPTARTLLLIGLGGSALVGIALAHPGAQTGRLRRAVLGFVVFCNLVLAPLAFVPLAYSSMVLERPHHSLAAAVDEDAELCVILNAPAELSFFYPAALRRSAGRPWPAHVYPLFAGMQPLDVTRIDARTLELRSDAGWAALGVDRFARDWRLGFAIGDTVELEHMRVEVLDISPDGRPTQIRVQLDRSLDGVQLLGFGRDGAPGDALDEWTPGVGQQARFHASL